MGFAGQPSLTARPTTGKRPSRQDIEKVAARVAAMYRIPVLAAAAANAQKSLGRVQEILSAAHFDLEACLATAGEVGVEADAYRSALEKVRAMIADVGSAASQTREGSRAVAASEVYRQFHHTVYGGPPGDTMT